MKIGFLITARLKSSRLKLKLLLPLNGKLVIKHIIDRAKKVIGCDDIVLCTSKLNQDFILVKIAQNNNIYYFNGNPEDVLQRLLDACKLYGFEYFVGITADNPLFSIHHANILIDKIKQDTSIDYIYTTGMPIGVNIYAMNVKALETVCKIKEQTDTEIWGYLINRPEIFNVQEIKASKEFIRNEYRLTLDEFDDYRLFAAIFNKFQKNEIIDVLDAYALLDANPEIVAMNRKVKQLDLAEDIKNSINEFYKINKEKILKIKEEIYSHAI